MDSVPAETELERARRALPSSDSATGRRRDVALRETRDIEWARTRSLRKNDLIGEDSWAGDWRTRGPGGPDSRAGPSARCRWVCLLGNPESISGVGPRPSRSPRHPPQPPAGPAPP